MVNVAILESLWKMILFFLAIQRRINQRCFTTQQVFTIFCFALIMHANITGIVIGAWPCGTVTKISELFSAESKTQVYGTLHAFLQENQDKTKEIGNILSCYNARNLQKN